MSTVLDKALLRCVACVLAVFLTPGLRAQHSTQLDSSQLIISDLVKHWQTLKRLSVDVAQAIPESEYALKANEMDLKLIGTVPSELNGIALVNVLSCSLGFGVEAPPTFQSAFDRPMDATKANVIMNLTAAYDFCLDGLNQTKDIDLFKNNRVFKGRPANRFDIILGAYARSTLGVGVVSMYARSKGIQLPDMGPRFDF